MTRRRSLDTYKTRDDSGSAVVGKTDMSRGLTENAGITKQQAARAVVYLWQQGLLEFAPMLGLKVPPRLLEEQP